MEMFTNKEGAAIVPGLVRAIQENKDYLSEIDGAIGDGDHGINMNKGFTLCGERLTGGEDLSGALETLGEILLCEIGGSMGPIYGTFFGEMGQAVRNWEEIGEAEFGRMLEAGLAGIRELVPTDVGDKTLLDALIPAVNAYREAEEAGKGFAEALDAAAEAAEAGRDATKDMVAKVGRASRLGERSRGVLDAGASSCAVIVRSMCETAKGLLG
ncbi:dihydroxyacetone kinase subunit DhaL [Christensenella tenuis]|jgi:phosphoenolpyruvate---glycerone phosphotransferase subunit DhaL|uniref:Dihydroxyacetone kinase subunit L n=1 Tax=Christensenella tenuis TaxID=2763033 RepID=A0ABR7EDC4_9FIRM|nr:dihydroxyacetone kinase subunit DhaL [Christensenella tenuis]MBC5647787.1 dihydroxyacetone kinase subunit L [Christensenella tenuis]